MAEFITKPIDVERLTEVLQQGALLSAALDPG